MLRKILLTTGVSAILAVVPTVAAASATVMGSSPISIMGSSTSNTQVRYAGDQWSNNMPNFEGATWRTPTSKKHGAYSTVPGASWLSVSSNTDHGLNPHWTEYRTSFNKLSGDHDYAVKFLSDNEVARMTVNGHAFGCTVAAPCAGFSQSPPLEQAIPASYLHATGNELRLVVLNYEYGWSASGGLTFSVEATDPPDYDGDGVADRDDAFPLDNHEQTDTDGDGTGNNADTDDDGDGVSDSGDAFPLDKDEHTDTDGDGTGNNADTDDDNDTVTDGEDACGTQSGRAQNGCPMPVKADQCKKDGHRNYGTTFKNQGDCVSYVATGGTNEPDGS